VAQRNDPARGETTLPLFLVMSVFLLHVEKNDVR
jgi:hypothetical protein